MKMWSRFLPAIIAGATLLWSAAPSSTQTSPDAATLGQWSAVQTWPIVSVHAQMLPTGKVMFYPYSDEPYLWDPVGGQIASANFAGYNLFCTGHSFLADGRLFVTGGHISNEVGLPTTAIYNPFNGNWTRLPDMNAGRWYPTNTTLPNGDVLVVSGVIDRTVWYNALPQVWETAANQYRDLTSAELVLPLYPFMFVGPDGRVFNAGPNADTRYLDTTGRGRWTPVANTNFNAERTYGSAVMYEPGKIMIVGGGDPPTATAELIDLRSSSPSWRYAAPMSVARRQNNATVLPDGKVFVTGGSSGPGFDNANAPASSTEMWDPSTDTWTQMAPITQYRGYHSIALLLPDGRVLSAGGDNHPSIEVYSPPYLFRGARPTITSAPVNATWNQQFQVSTPDAAGISAVSLIRLSSVTHAFNQDQRFERLTFSVSPGTLTVTGPASANVAPPGPYWLFILNNQGVPSVGHLMYIGSTAAPVPTGPAAPIALTATAVSPTQVDLSWTDASNNEDGFKIERALGSSTTFTEIGSAGANATAFSDLTAQPSTGYSYRVRAYNPGGTALSNTATATTPASSSPAGRRRFNGTSDYIDFPAAPQLNTGTFSFFFTPLSLPASSERDVLITYANEGEPEPFATHDKQLFVAADGTLKARVYAGGGRVATSTTRLTVGRRYHIGMTISATTLTVYVDGVATGTAATTGSYAGYGNPFLRMAGRPQSVEAGSPSARAHGDFTQLGVWNVALSAGQMASLASGAAVSTIEAGALVVAANLTADPATADMGGPLVANGTTFVTDTSPPPQPLPPAAPTGLTATAVSPTRVNLAWTDASTNEDGFKIERAAGGANTFSEVGSAAVNATSFIDPTVQPATSYIYRVRAFNAAGSSVSQTANVTTPQVTGTAGRRRFNGTSDYIDFPAAPQLDTATFALFFTPLSLPAASERDVLITYANEGETEPFNTHDKQLFIAADGTLKARVYAGGVRIATSATRLVVGRRYHIGMTISATTLTVYVDGVATGTTATAGSYAGYGNPLLRMAGLPPSLEGGATSTRAHGDVTQLGVWNGALTATEMGSLAAGTDVATVQPGMLVVAARFTGDPPTADVGGPLVANGTTFVSDTTPPPPTESAPAAPTGLTATAPSSTRVNLAWSDASSNEAGFRIERAPGGTTTFVEIGAAAANATTFSDLSVQASTSYSYRVRAFNQVGSAVSNTVTVTTPRKPGKDKAPATARPQQAQ